ncbi:MAG: cytochrome c [Cytophagales bacterium]|nr:MAG: cytochrome c [Cytophagales bacterium]
MLTPDKIRQLIPVLNGLIALVISMFCLLAVVAFMQPDGSNDSTSATGTTVAAVTPTAAPVVAALTPAQEHGKSLFTGNCSQCHNLTEVDMVGPGLKGARARTPGDEWLKKWIKNSTALIATGDPYAVQVFNKFQKIPMSSFTNLSDEDLTDLIDYIGTAK